MNKDKKTGLLIIATNKYVDFLQPLIESADKFLLKRYDVTYFIFTNKDIKVETDRKVEYIKNVFSFFIENEKEFHHFDEEKMQKELITIKGIGKWTIEMFLMFELGKPDIFSKGDIALINSVKKNYKMKIH